MVILVNILKWPEWFFCWDVRLPIFWSVDSDSWEAHDRHQGFGCFSMRKVFPYEQICISKRLQKAPPNTFKRMQNNHWSNIHRDVDIKSAWRIHDLRRSAQLGLRWTQRILHGKAHWQRESLEALVEHALLTPAGPGEWYETMVNNQQGLTSNNYGWLCQPWSTPSWQLTMANQQIWWAIWPDQYIVSHCPVTISHQVHH